MHSAIIRAPGASFSFLRRHSNKGVFAISLAIYACVSFQILSAEGARAVRLRVDLAPLAAIPPALQVHIACALGAFLLGSLLLLGRHSRKLHRRMGYVWVILMAVTAGSSFFLTGVNGDRLSFIHLLSGWTVIALPLAIGAVRSRQTALHREIMTRLFSGAMLIAGLFTFLPGRFMWDLFFSA